MKTQTIPMFTELTSPEEEIAQAVNELIRILVEDAPNLLNDLLEATQEEIDWEAIEDIGAQFQEWLENDAQKLAQKLTQ